jgi:hypothetical protein
MSRKNSATSYHSYISHDDSQRMQERNRILGEADMVDRQISNQIQKIQ